MKSAILNENPMIFLYHQKDDKRAKMESTILGGFYEENNLEENAIGSTCCNHGSRGFYRMW